MKFNWHFNFIVRFDTFNCGRLIVWSPKLSSAWFVWTRIGAHVLDGVHNSSALKLFSYSQTITDTNLFYQLYWHFEKTTKIATLYSSNFFVIWTCAKFNFWISNVLLDIKLLILNFLIHCNILFDFFMF